MRGLGGGLNPRAYEFTGSPEDAAQAIAHIGSVAKELGQQMPHTFPHVVSRRQRLGRIDKVLRASIHILLAASRVQHLHRQGLQPSFAGLRGQRLFFRFEGQIEILQPLGGFGGLNLRGKFLSQPALSFDRFEDLLFSVFQSPQLLDPPLDFPNPFFVQTSGLIFTVACDERDCVAIVQQHHSALDLVQRKLNPFSYEF